MRAAGRERKVMLASARSSTSTLSSAASTRRATSLPATHCTDEDVYLAIPLQKGQISCRELMRGEVVMKDVKAHEAIHIDDIDSPYATNDDLKRLIMERGI